MQNRKKTTSFWFNCKQIFTNKKVLIALFATLILLILFRIGSTITIPGIKIRTVNNSFESSFLGILNLLGGGGISQLSFMSLGVSPYITAQIIMQLLSTDLIKPLVRWNKAGERGRRKIEILTRILTIPFALMQAYAVLSLASNSNIVTSFFGYSNLATTPTGLVFLLLVGISAGTFLTIFIADIISKKGIGNGVTLIILSGIVASIYPNFSNIFLRLSQINTVNTLLKYFGFFVYIIFFLLVLLATTFMNGSVRKIPISQIGQGMTKGINEMAYLPIKLNPAGVIPVIFASSIMTIAPTISQFLPASSSGNQFINDYLAIETPFGLSIYAFLIILFGFFYSHIQINSEKLAENFQKSGKFIPGIKIGEQTQKYISRTLNRINFIGIPFLMIIAIIPYLISLLIPQIPQGLAVGGTGIIIMVTASLDFWYSLNSAKTSYTYTRTIKQLQKRNEKAQISQSIKQKDQIGRLW